MNIKELKRAQKAIEELKVLDEEILKINNLAQQLANKKCKIEFRVEDFDKKYEEENRVEIDENGDLTQQLENAMSGFNGVPGSMFGISFSYPKNVKLNSHIKKEYWEISDVTALNLLAVLLIEKQDKRKSIVKKLEKLNIEI